MSFLSRYSPNAPSFWGPNDTSSAASPSILLPSHPDASTVNCNRLLVRPYRAFESGRSDGSKSEQMDASVTTGTTTGTSSSSSSSLIAPRRYHASCSHANNLFISCGYTAHDYKFDLFHLNLETGIMSQLKHRNRDSLGRNILLPQPRSGGTAAYDPHDKTLYLFGGWYDWNRSKDDCHLWAYKDNRWTLHDATLKMNNVFWSGAKMKLTSRRELIAFMEGITVIYNLHEGKWTVCDISLQRIDSVSNAPGKPSPLFPDSGLVSISEDDRSILKKMWGYCATLCSWDGKDSHFLITTGSSGPRKLNSTYAFCIREQKWYKVMPHGIRQPMERSLAAAATVGDRYFFMHGGDTGEASGLLHDWWCFDLQLLKWTPIQVDIEKETERPSALCFENKTDISAADMLSGLNLDENKSLQDRSTTSTTNTNTIGATRYAFSLPSVTERTRVENYRKDVELARRSHSLDTVDYFGNTCLVMFGGFSKSSKRDNYAYNNDVLLIRPQKGSQFEWAFDVPTQRYTKTLHKLQQESGLTDVDIVCRDR